VHGARRRWSRVIVTIRRRVCRGGGLSLPQALRAKDVAALADGDVQGAAARLAGAVAVAGGQAAGLSRRSISATNRASISASATRIKECAAGLLTTGMFQLYGNFGPLSRRN
jgi:hypothetical protein